jgi:hypothetical protein
VIPNTNIFRDSIDLCTVAIAVKYKLKDIISPLTFPSDLTSHNVGRFRPESDQK